MTEPGEQLLRGSQFVRRATEGVLRLASARLVRLDGLVRSLAPSFAPSLRDRIGGSVEQIVQPVDAKFEGLPLTAFVTALGASGISGDQIVLESVTY
jgi:hypothetical protein